MSALLPQAADSSGLRPSPVREQRFAAMRLAGASTSMTDNHAFQTGGAAGKNILINGTVRN